MEETILTAKDLKFRYDPEQPDYALNGVSAEVKRGEFVAVLGANGCGKSTLAKHFNAILLPESGTVLVEGMDTKDEDKIYDIRQTVGMVFQNPDNQIVATVVEEDVAFALENLGVPPEEMRRRVDDSMKMAGIYEYRERAPHNLSGGQKQRVAIARALANDPNVLLCDEATSALDPQTTKAILRLLKDLNEKLGITVVIITHEMAVVKEICDRVAVMEHGRVVEQGEVFNVFADPRQEITRSFIHTTSNLRKIEELIEEDSPVVQLKPGELIVRLSYIQRNVSEPLISTVSRKFDITLNIIFSDIAIVQNAPIGGTVAIISGERAQITQAMQYLSEKNVGVEVIRDARISE